MTNKQGFVKLFLPRSSKTQMLIPSTFMHCIGGSLPKRIFLRDRHLNLWTVKAEQVGKKWYFKNGWEKFVMDNKILPRDTIVFDYFDEDLFNVKITGPNGCETEGAGMLMSLDFNDETEEEEEDDSEKGDDALKIQEDYLSEESEDGDDETEDSDYLPDQENKVEQDVSGQNKDDDDDGIEDVDYLSIQKTKLERDLPTKRRDDEKNIEDVDYLPDKRLKVEQDSPEKNKDDNNNNNNIDAVDCLPDKRMEVEQDLPQESKDDDSNDMEDSDYVPDKENKEVQVQNANNTKRKRKTQPSLYPKYHGIEIFEKGLATQPTNPYFVTTVNANRTFDLFIPLPLIEDYKLDLPKPKMLMVDPHGFEFQGKYKKWTDGRILYAGQWKYLLRRNKIDIGDTCICEFIEGPKGLYLKASFLRTSTNQN